MHMKASDHPKGPMEIPVKIILEDPTGMNEDGSDKREHEVMAAQGEHLLESMREAIEISERPTAITHANPTFWHPALRNKSNDVLKALANSGGMLGLSLYPHHLKGKSECTLEDFCAMVARTVELIGVRQIGFGSDLCQDQPDTVVEWMRNGTWTHDTDYGEGFAGEAGFPMQPNWFRDNLGFGNILRGLRDVGFSEQEIARIAGENWLDFFERSFGPQEGIE